jgi:hypothetical protein
MARYNFDLGEAGMVLFFQMGLDSPNQLDPVEQIRPCAHAFISVMAGLVPAIHALSWATKPGRRSPGQAR